MDHALQRLEHPGRWRIRILIRIELDPSGILRLLARHVPLNRINIRSEKTHAVNSAAVSRKGDGPGARTSPDFPDLSVTGNPGRTLGSVPGSRFAPGSVVWIGDLLQRPEWLADVIEL